MDDRLRAVEVEFGKVDQRLVPGPVPQILGPVPRMVPAVPGVVGEVLDEVVAVAERGRMSSSSEAASRAAQRIRHPPRNPPL